MCYVDIFCIVLNPYTVVQNALHFKGGAGLIICKKINEFFTFPYIEKLSNLPWIYASPISMEMKCGE